MRSSSPTPAPRLLPTLLVALLAACSSSSNQTAATPDASTDSGSDTGASTQDAGTGSATVMGSADGTPFTTAAMAILLGSPDSATSTVVYVFSKPVMCSDLATPGWDKRITNATQFLELKMEGLAPATFNVVTTPTPAPGEATVNYTLSTTTGVPVETVGSGGTVTLTKLTAMTGASGSFAIKFANDAGTNTLTGTYDAVFCPGGHEP